MCRFSLRCKVCEVLQLFLPAYADSGGNDTSEDSGKSDRPVVCPYGFPDNADALYSCSQGKKGFEGVCTAEELDKWLTDCLPYTKSGLRLVNATRFQSFKGFGLCEKCPDNRKPNNNPDT